MHSLSTEQTNEKTIDETSKTESKELKLKVKFIKFKFKNTKRDNETNKIVQKKKSRVEVLFNG